MVYLQCTIEHQDCTSLYPPTAGYPPFTNESCVIDPRLEGNIGRCGFPGAKCTVDAVGNNCAVGPVCMNGICGGQAVASSYAQGLMNSLHRATGDFCDDQRTYCNYGPSCNGTVCGGAGANLYDINGDFARDYCLSGLAHPSTAINGWSCSEGPPLILSSTSTTVGQPSSTSSSTSSISSASSTSSASLTSSATTKSPIGAIVGSVIGGLAVAGLLFVLWRRKKIRMQNSTLPDEFGTRDAETSVSEHSPIAAVMLPHIGPSTIANTYATKPFPPLTYTSDLGLDAAGRANPETTTLGSSHLTRPSPPAAVEITTSLPPTSREDTQPLPPEHSLAVSPKPLTSVSSQPTFMPIDVDTRTAPPGRSDSMSPSSQSQPFPLSHFPVTSASERELIALRDEVDRHLAEIRVHNFLQQRQEGRDIPPPYDVF